MIKAVPEGYHRVTPILVFQDANKAIAFYRQAFDAQVRFILPSPDGKGVIHAEILIGNSIVMLREENRDQLATSCETLGGSPVSFYLYRQDVDQAFNAAIEAGAQSMSPVEEMFWGDRVGTVQDPFGYRWMLATHTKDPTPQEMEHDAYAPSAKRRKEHA